MQIRYTGKSKQFPELRGEITEVSSEDTFYVYGMKVIDSSILPIYNIKIQDSSKPNFETPEDTIMIPVFANAEDIDSISKETDLTQTPHDVIDSFKYDFYCSRHREVLLSLI